MCLKSDKIAGDEVKSQRKCIDSSVLGKLPRFDGKSNVKQFIKSVNKRGILEKWSDEEKASVIAYLCTGFAETFIDSQPNIDETDYDDICELLIGRFTPKLSTPDAYSMLLQIKQHKRSVNSFAEEIETTAANVADVIDDLKEVDKRNELLVSVFMAGLDPHLKRLLTASEFDDFTELIRAAKRCEETFQDSRRYVNVVENDHSSNSRNPHYQNNMQEQQHNPRRPIMCWYCGKPGHIQRDCRKRLSEAPNKFMNYTDNTTPFNPRQTAPFYPNQYPSNPKN